MDIDVTRIYRKGDALRDYADSIANSGRQDIGQVTWANAVEACKRMRKPLVPSDRQDELRAWIRDFGAWDDAEVEAMSDVETNALLLQFVAGDCLEYRESKDAEQTRLYKADNGKLYFYVGC